MGLLIQLLSLVTCLLEIYTLNNSDFNCAVPLIHRFFKLNTYYSTIWPQVGWTPVCGTVDVRGLTAKLYVDFQLCGVSMPLTPMLFKGQLCVGECVYVCVCVWMCVCECVCVYNFTIFCDMSLFETSQKLGEDILACMADKRLISSIKKDFL